MKINAIDNLVPNGDLSSITTISSTSGSTGEPIYYPRGEIQDEQYAHIAELFLKRQFGVDNRKRTLCIVGFGLGIWIGGIFTYKTFNLLARRGSRISLAPVGVDIERYLHVLKKFGSLYDQIILTGYPPLVKDIIDLARRERIPLRSFHPKIMMATESFTEQFREHLAARAGLQNRFRDIVNIYGSVELGTMAYETPIAALIRSLSLRRPKLFHDLFPNAKLQPTLAQYHPYLTYFEAQEGELFATGWGSSFPLIRYRLHDRGGVISFERMVEILQSHGVNILKEAQNHGIADTVMRLPFVYVYERSDFVVILRGANIYPEHVKIALQDRRFSRFVSGKFTMIKRDDKALNEYLEINIELVRGTGHSSSLIAALRNTVTQTLRKLNSEFNDQYQSSPKRATPRIVLWPFQYHKYFKPGIKQRWMAKA